MADYTDDIATAQELLEEFGQQCYWQKPAPVAAGVPGYPTETELPEPIPCMIAFFNERDLNRGADEFKGMMQGTEVPKSCMIGLMAGGISFEPENNDMIHRGTVDAEPIAIKSIDIVAPDGTPVLYYISVAA